MSAVSGAFKECCHASAAKLGIKTSELVRDYLLNEFMEEILDESDDEVAVVVKAVAYFIEDDVAEQDPVFRLVVFSIALFLHKRLGQDPTQAVRDLIGVLRQSRTEDTVRGWMKSRFG